MGLLDLFKFTPPGDKKYGLFLSNYIKEEQHILECFGDIAASGSVDELKLDFDLFAKEVLSCTVQVFPPKSIVVPVATLSGSFKIMVTPFEW